MKIAEIINEGIIAYHGSGTRIKQFWQNSVNPHYFTTDRSYALGYAGKQTSYHTGRKKPGNYLITVELEISRPFDTKTDKKAVNYHNTVFLPHMNEIFVRFGKEPIPEIQLGRYVSFVYADDLYRFMSRAGSPYDAILVDEGGLSGAPAIAPLHANQIRVKKIETIRDGGKIY